MREDREGMLRLNRKSAVTFDCTFAAFEVGVDNVSILACLNEEIQHEELRKEEKGSVAIFSLSEPRD